jgi:uracil-DNA glycosylase
MCCGVYIVRLLSENVWGDSILSFSLLNIYKELSHDIPGFEAPNHGNLIGWARQGE